MVISEFVFSSVYSAPFINHFKKEIVMRPWDLKSLFLTCLIVIFSASFAGGDGGFSLISKDQLKQELTKPDVVVIDVRVPSDWDASQLKIQGAKRESPAQVSEWMPKYSKDETIVLYCA